jgi:hypothetical protein
VCYHGVVIGIDRYSSAGYHSSCRDFTAETQRDAEGAEFSE